MIPVFKRAIAVVVAVSLAAGLCAVPALADEPPAGAEIASGTFEGSNVEWSIDADGVLAISGEGKIEFEQENGFSQYPWVDHRDKIELVIVEDGVAFAGPLNYMFKGCGRLTTFKAPNCNVSEVTDMSHMFEDCFSLATIDLSGWDTSQVANMACMFTRCSSLETVDVSGFDTAKVTSMESMFAECHSLTNLDVSGFKTSEVTSMNSMFMLCNNLTSLDVSGFDTSKVTSMFGMFAGCGDLTSLDVSGFDTSNVFAMNYMFAECSSLTSLDLSSFDTTSTKSGYWDYVNEEKIEYHNVGGLFSSCTSLGRLAFGPKWTAELRLEQGVIDEKDYVEGELPPGKTWYDAVGEAVTFPWTPKPGVYTTTKPQPVAPSPSDPKPGTTPSKPTPPATGTTQPTPQPTPPTTATPAKTSIADATVTVKDKAYNGKALKPSSVVVKVGGRTLRQGADYTVSCKGGKKIGVYTVTVTGKGTYTGTMTAKFNVVPKGVTAKKPSAAKRGFTAKWKRPASKYLKQTTGYQVQWSTDKKFKKAVKSKLVKGAKKTSLKVTKLKPKKTYYVKVRAYKQVGKTKYYSAWSKIQKVKTKK